MSEIKILFVHGGPGLNCEPERQLLSAQLHRAGFSAKFWDEPSNLRPDGDPFHKEFAYKNWLQSLHREIQSHNPAILVGMSFGALGALDALSDYGCGSVKHLLMIAPTLVMDRVFKTMMDFSQKDFASLKDRRADDLAVLLKQSRELWDDSMQKGLDLVWANPNLLTHYFTKLEFLTAWAGGLSKAEYQIDFVSQKAVLGDLALRLKKRPEGKRLPIPVTILYGDKDPVFDQAEVGEFVKSRFSAINFTEYKPCGHFPHLEHTKDFLTLLKTLSVC